MSTPSPLLPPGALEGAAAPKSRVRITVLTILALHVVFIGGLLMQGCQKNAKDMAGTNTVSSNALSSLPSLTDTYFTNYPGDTTSSAPPAAAPITPDPSVTSSAPRSLASAPPSNDTYPSGAYTPPQNDFAVTSPAPALSSSGSPVSMGAGTEHTIKKNDTIGSLAKQYGVTIQAIKDANPDVRPKALKIGAKLIIPPPTAQTQSSATVTELPVPPGGESYVVQRGDNLTKIARKFGVTAAQIRSANALHNDRILPKQRLIIPAKATNTEPATSATPRSF